MMAYRLPRTNKAYDEDYYDDSEHGGGRRLFRVLVDEDVFSVVGSNTILWATATGSQQVYAHTPGC